MDNGEMSEIFKSWNEGELDSFLIEISTNILKYKDESGDFLLEKIRDSAGQKGTGRMDLVWRRRCLLLFLFRQVDCYLCSGVRYASHLDWGVSLCQVSLFSQGGEGEGQHHSAWS